MLTTASNPPRHGMRKVVMSIPEAKLSCNAVTT